MVSALRSGDSTEMEDGGLFSTGLMGLSPQCSHRSEDLSEEKDVALEHLEGEYSKQEAASTCAKDRHVLGRLDEKWEDRVAGVWHMVGSQQTWKKLAP